MLVTHYQKARMTPTSNLGYHVHSQPPDGVTGLRATEFVESYFDAWNHRDARLVAKHLANGGTYCDVPLNQQQSREELIEHLIEFFTYNEHRYALHGEILRGENSVAFQYSVTSSGVDSDVFFGAEFVTLDDSAAVEILDYYEISNVAHAPPVELANKYTKSGLNPSQMAKYRNRLEILMQTDKAYRRPDLSLPKLASLVGCSVNHLSQVINSGIGTNFFDYLNQYRIEYAKRLLGEQIGRNESVLSIAFTVGFNSNSSFYAAFKKANGLTPAQYRQSLKMRDKK